MDKRELLQKIRELAVETGGWRVVLNGLDLSDYVMGYHHNDETNMYEVYVNNERGRHKVRLSTTDETEALTKLLSLVSYEAKMHRRYIKMKK